MARLPKFAGNHPPAAFLSVLVEKWMLDDYAALESSKNESILAASRINLTTLA